MYIGKSIDISTRWKQHFDKFTKGTAAKAMQEEYNRYGYPQGEVLVECHSDHIDIMEECLISRLAPELNGTRPKDPLAGIHDAEFLHIVSQFGQSTVGHIREISRLLCLGEDTDALVQELTETNDKLSLARDKETLAADVAGRITNLAKVVKLRDDEIKGMHAEMRTMHNEIMYHRRPWWQKVFN